MKTSLRVSLLALVGVAVLLAVVGCKHHEGAYVGKVYDGGEKQTCYIQEEALMKALSIDNQQYKRLANGAMKVETIIRNRTKQRVAIECRTEFKDAEYFGLDDQTAWEFIVLQPLASTTYVGLSTVTNAERFAVHIRPGTK